MEAQLLEIVPFLRDRNPQARHLALSNLLPQTVPGAPYRDTLFFRGLGGGGLHKTKESDVIRDLKLLCRDQLNVAHDAFRALVNLSDSPLLGSLSDPIFLSFIVSYIINPQSICADLASMLLSNLTAFSPACGALLTMKISVILHKDVLYPVDSRCGSSPEPVPYPKGPEKQVPALPLLVEAFVQGATICEIAELSKRPRKGELHFLASVFANMSVSPTGRTFFLSPQLFQLAKGSSKNLQYPLSKIVPFTEHNNPTRRKGIASTLKNCAFNHKAHKAILSPDSDQVAVRPSTIAAPGIGALSYILLPLAGPEEFDLEDQEKLLPELQFLPPEKKREPDASTRLALVETLLLLCHTRWGRDYQRSHGAYEIIRGAHMEEKNENVQEHMERCVQLLKGDEPKVSQTGDEDEDVEGDLIGEARISPHDDSDEDDEDFKIEEI